MSSEQYFISRELSWMEFNARVLDEAATLANPLLERLKFIAIFSSNLDEFFMVRVSGLRQLVKMGDDSPDVAGCRPSEQLKLLRRKLDKLLPRQEELLEGIVADLAKDNKRLVKFKDLDAKAKVELGKFFSAQILPVLTPLAIDPSHPFPILNSGAVEIAVSMTVSGSDEVLHAFVEVPEGLPRFIPVADGRKGITFVALEELIGEHLGELFVDCNIIESFPFRITRDMDFSVDEDGAEDLLLSIERNLLQRRHREPIRLEMGHSGEGKLAKWLCSEFQIDELYRYTNCKFLHMKQLFELVGKCASPELMEEQWKPLTPPELDTTESIFEQIDAAWPILLATPYHSFNPVVKLLEEAADDPDVLAIKQTLYRVSGNSPIVHALQRAAENGKQVTVIVELKARFDEGNNIIWAKRLEESGAHVVYGISKLKIHCKALLIVRKEGGYIRRYLHLGTGNYNDKTANLYTDMGIMTCDPDLCFDVANLFNVMTGYSAPPTSWRKIAASPFDMRERVLSLIDRETRFAEAGQKARIIAKMNSLADPEVIEHLHAAAAAGVEIDLIVRGICCFRPPVGSENVRVISIVDRYLEHTRCFYFCNGGAEEFYLASADWMYRNLSRRIEIFFPIEDTKLRKILMTLLNSQLKDSDKGRRLQASGRYTRNLLESYSNNRSQYNSWKYLNEISKEKFNSSDMLKVFTAPEHSSDTH